MSVLFRPRSHAERFNRSLARMSMPELPTGLFLEALHQLVSLDRDWVPTSEGASLYLRPFMFATDTSLGAGRPSRTYLFVVIASPSAPYFVVEPRAISVWLSDRYVRAAAGSSIEPGPDGAYVIDKLWTVKAMGGASFVRDSNGRKELLVPVTLTNGRAEVVLELKW